MTLEGKDKPVIRHAWRAADEDGRMMMMFTRMNVRRRILMGMMMIIIMVTVFSRSITSVTYLWPLANPRVHT